MPFDIIATKKTPLIEQTAKKLGLTTFSLEELRNLRIIEGKDDKTIRDALENRKADILLNPHAGREKDKLSQRNSGLNHILCELARRNTTTIAISLDQCYESKDLGRIMQNIHLCRKYNTKLIFLSMAKTAYELRNPQDIISLGKTLGMSTQQATESINYLAEILKRKGIKY